jgi:hypothetical protein
LQKESVFLVSACQRVMLLQPISHRRQRSLINLPPQLFRPAKAYLAVWDSRFQIAPGSVHCSFGGLHSAFCRALGLGGESSQATSRRQAADLASVPYPKRISMWPKPTSGARTTGSMHFSQVHQVHSKVVCFQHTFPVEIARFGWGFRHQVTLWARSIASAVRLGSAR